jgi:N-acetylmuramoyl-L-alanine amidase
VSRPRTRRAGPAAGPVAAPVALAVAVTLALAACGGGSAPTTAAGTSGSPALTGAAATSTASPGTPTTTLATTPASTTPRATATATATAGGTATDGVTAASAKLGSLRGKVILIDPGHNGGNGAHPSQINRQVYVGNGYKACDTTGTQTNAGYPEHTYTWDVAGRLAALLRAAGARVVLTRSSDTGVGPCITDRAAAGNTAHADLAISVHADGGPAGGLGFHVIEPGSIGSNAAIVAPSRRLGTAIRDAFRSGTGEPYANYIAHSGIDVRTDLGGLNLSTVPKVFIECGNMRNATDAARLTSASWRQRAAQALANGMAAYLAGG